VRPRAAHQSRGHATPVGAAVEREVVPPVGVLFAGARRQVRRVRDDSVEPSRAVEQVRAHGNDRERGVARGPGEPLERVGVPVRRDDARPRARGLEREGAVAGADVEHPRAGSRARERTQELRVLALGVDRTLGEPLGRAAL